MFSKCTLDNENNLFGLAFNYFAVDDKPFYYFEKHRFRWYYLTILFGKTIYWFSFKGKYLGHSSPLKGTKKK